jgi:hypothetical protein
MAFEEMGPVDRGIQTRTLVGVPDELSLRGCAWVRDTLRRATIRVDSGFPNNALDGVAVGDCPT